MRFLNASVLLRKALNRNLSSGFPLGNLLPKTRVLKHRDLELKRRPNANASVLRTQRFRTLRTLKKIRTLHFPDTLEKKKRTSLISSCKCGWPTSRHVMPLVAQPLDPPLSPIAPMLFRYRRVSRCTPQNLPYPSGAEGVAGVSQLKLPCGGYRAIREDR